MHGRAAERAKRLDVAPVRLRQDPDPEALRLQQAGPTSAMPKLG
jgi:hypothetical protein